MLNPSPRGSAPSPVRPRLFVALALSVALLAGCGGSSTGGDGGSPPPPPPAAGIFITSQPVDLTVVNGGDATFQVGTKGNVTLRWQRQVSNGWVDIEGATAGSYTMHGVDSSNDGTVVQAVVTNADKPSDTLTSSAATLTVSPIPVPVTIGVQPSDAAVFMGQDAAFSVTAIGTSPSYQWMSSTDGRIFTPIGGATQATLTLPAVALSASGTTYQVVVTNYLSAVTSAVVHLTVMTAPAAPTFSTLPADVSATVGTDARFTAAVTGVPTPTLQWQSSPDGTTWSDLAGETATTLVLHAVGTGDDGRLVRVVATNTSGSVTTPAARLTVTPVPVLPVVTTQPVGATVGVGATPTFTVAGTGVPTPTIQWQVSTDTVHFTNINGATSANYTLPPTAIADDGKRFRASLRNVAGTVTSQYALLTVIDAPQITRQPRPQGWRTGMPSPIFQVTATGQAPLTYQWQVRDVAGSTFADVPGATSDTAFIAPPATNDQVVRVVVTDAAGHATNSAGALLSSLAWSQVSLSPGSSTQVRLHWFDTDKLVSVGAGGAIQRSADGGLTWAAVRAQGPDDAYFLRAVDFASTTVGLAVGDGGRIVRTEDAGLHWLTVRTPSTGGELLADVAFVDATTAITVGSGGTVLRSTDAGRTWANVTTGDTGSFQGVAFQGAVGVAFTQEGHVLRTINGGAQWSLAWDRGSALSAGRVVFADANTVVIGTDQALARSTDGGATWTEHPLPDGFTGTSILFTSATEGLEFPNSAAAAMYLTHDGGATWVPGPIMTAPTFWVAASPTGVLVGDGPEGQTFRSTDSGATWIAHQGSTVPFSHDLTRVVATHDGQAVAMSGFLTEYTTDGGLHWSDSTMTPGWSGRVTALDAPALGTTVFSVGDQQMVSASTDGGRTWSWRASMAAGTLLNGLAFLDDQTGLAVTTDGAILKTTDGGNSWPVLRSGGVLGDCFSDVAYASSLQVITGCHGALLTSHDGGAHWALVVSGTNASLAPAISADQQVMVAAGSAADTGVGSVLRSADGGKSWQTVLSMPGTPFGRPWFISATEGWVPAGEQVWHTTDAGVTWQLDLQGESALAGVALSDGHTSVAVGLHGSVLVRSR